MTKDSYALVCYQGDYYNNLGDDIQALAALQYLKRVDHYIPIDQIGEFKRLDPFQNSKVKAILNGWYTSNPDSWPPSKEITPLIISFHLTDEVYPGYPHLGPNTHRTPADVLLTSSSIHYFKEHEPIGCRDLTTMERMRKKGIDAYFSGCLSLTFDSQTVERQDHICIVDVWCDIENLIRSAPASLKPKIRFMTHNLPNAGRYTIQERFEKANGLLKTYRSAALVITSRLHCALPCLAFGTPVIFVLPQRGLSRLPGLLELMHYCSREDMDLGEFQIPWLNPVPNPVDIKPLSENLRSRCSSFIA